METFRDQKITNEYNGFLIKAWDGDEERKVDDIFGPYPAYMESVKDRQEEYLMNLKIPFITTIKGSVWTIFKEQKAKHVK